MKRTIAADVQLHSCWWSRTIELQHLFVQLNSTTMAIHYCHSYCSPLNQLTTYYNIRQFAESVPVFHVPHPMSREAPSGGGRLLSCVVVVINTHCQVRNRSSCDPPEWNATLGLLDGFHYHHRHPFPKLKPNSAYTG